MQNATLFFLFFLFFSSNRDVECVGKENFSCSTLLHSASADFPRAIMKKDQMVS